MSKEFTTVHDTVEPVAGTSIYSATPGDLTFTIATADTWTFMTGTATASESTQFTVDATGSHYTGSLTRKFFVQGSVTSKFSSAGAEVHYGYYYNGTIYTPSVAGNYMLNINQPYFIGGSSVIELATNDTIRVVAKVNKTGTLTVNHYTAVITPWGR